MAEHADGSIIVDTDLDTSGFKSGSAELKSAIKSLNSKVSGLGPTFQKAMSGSAKAMGTFEAKASALQSKITDLESKMARLGHARLPTEDYKFFSLELEKAKRHLEQLEAREAKMGATGAKQSSSAYKNLQYDISLAKEKIADLESTMAGMRQNGTAFQMGSSTPEYQQMEAALAAAKQQLAEMDAAASSVNANTSILSTVGERIASAFARAGSVIKSSVVSGLRMAATAAKTLLKHTLKAATGMSMLGKSSQKTGKMMSGMFRRMIMRMLMMYAIRSVLNSVKQGIDALAKSSSDFNNTMSQLKTSTSQLRNSFITAFAPILSVVVPILSTLISKLATAISYIGQFVSALTGAKTYTKAITKQQDYAASLDKTAKSAKEAKRQLAGFDELNVLSDSSSSGGGGAAEDPGFSFEQAPIESSVAGIAAKIKEAFANGEYYEIGKIVGEGLNHIVQKVYDVLTGIDWEGIGVAFGEGLNGFVHGVDWDLLGKTLGAYFMARLNVIYGAITTFDWAGAGIALGTAIMGLWSSIDWAKAGRTLSTAVIGVLNFISEGIKTIDWQKIGNDVAALVAGIDWSGMVAALVNGIGAALGGLASLLWGLIEDAWNSVVQWWYDVAYEDGVFTSEGLLIGIVDGIANIGNWIVENIFQPFINGFKSAFGIHSPSTVMQEQGGFIVEGLLLGITNAWTSITSFFGNALSSLTSLLSNGWQTIKQGASTAWDKVSGAVSGAWNTIKSATTNASSKVKSSVSTAWENAKKDITNNLDKAKSTASKAWDAIQKAVSTTGKNVGSDVATAWSNVKSTVSTHINSTKSLASSAWDSIKSTASSINKNISSTLKTEWNTIKSNVSSSLNNIKSTATSTWNSITSSINSSVNSTKNTVSSGFSSIYSSITSKLQSAMNAVKNLNWYSVGSNICDGIANGINAGWSWLSNTVSNLAGNLLKAAKRALGIHSPSRLFRDAVGLNIGYGIGEGIEDSEGSVLDSVVGVADAIAEEFNNGEYALNTAVKTESINDGLVSFSDKIVDGFAELMSRLQSIADGVTFAAPDVAQGVAPYSVAAAVNSNGRSDDRGYGTNDDISSVVIQSVNNATVAIVKAIQEYSQTNVNIDSDSLADSIINEINRRTRMTGKSPLLT